MMSSIRIFRVSNGLQRRALSTVAARSSGDYTKQDVLNLLNQRSQERNDLAYSTAFGDDTAFSLSSMVEPSALMREQLRFSQDQLLHSTVQSSLDTMALPKTLEDVVRQKSRAIVVTETEKPFRVVDVNECWEGLCGYSFREAHGKTLGSLLNGPATNQVAATGLIAHLLAGEEAGAVLVNYKKDGQEFCNRIRVGPIYDADNKITHFVGVLEELPQRQQQQRLMNMM
ncbi:PAS PAC sensor signal transduction histidine kinase [Seminavis robusta]|uniref:PAS PAC sensor signal transduction histidine kinase n=1 Tax=Seminavis robusta TaxID=568900 RepID=A0A9N8E374_9STRA|nr:PAS PAC sensor signal transduction histidine kinase [Seminavis robusta]|eukprot:Sro570_g168600.1 PAS PAC sensor signal transduction histidine kinase (228) ;mRNA; f:53958-54748